MYPGDIYYYIKSRGSALYEKIQAWVQFEVHRDFCLNILWAVFVRNGDESWNVAWILAEVRLGEIRLGENFAVGERQAITAPTTEFMVKLVCEGDGASFYYDQPSGPWKQVAAGRRNFHTSCLFLSPWYFLNKSSGSAFIIITKLNKLVHTVVVLFESCWVYNSSPLLYDVVTQ